MVSGRHVTSNIQYIHQPAGVKEVDDAWVAGLSVKVNFNNIDGWLDIV